MTTDTVRAEQAAAGAPGWLEAAPASYDPKTRTCEVTVATAARVVRVGPYPDGSGWGRFVEVLNIGGAQLGRIHGGPVLRDHLPYSGAKIGVVTRAWRDADRIMATLQFSDNEETRSFVRDVETGVQRHVSAGYRGLTVRKLGTENDLPVYELVTWELRPRLKSLAGVWWAR